MDPNEPVVVFTTNDPVEAEMLVAYLRDEGIQADTEGVTQAGLAGILDVKVLVRAWDADRARKLIEEHEHFGKK